VIEISRRTAIGMFTAATFGFSNLTSAMANPVKTEGFVTIGGLEQWISVTGTDPRAPLLLFLHGGPGEAMSPFPDIFLPYQRDFTVAIWDQRGSGKTFGQSGRATPGMDREQFVEDTIEVALHLRKQFNKEKVILVGQSWGAALGIQVAKRRPDLFYAFVGCGQPVSLEGTLLSQERYARTVFTAKKDTAGLAALDEAVKLPPTDPKRRFATRKVLFGSEDQTFLNRETAFLGPKPWPTQGPVADWTAGYTFTSEVLVPKILDKDVVDIVGFAIPLPLVVVQGSDDHITPTDVARDYVDKVLAPAKAFVEIRGGHFAFYTNQNGVLLALKQHVLPLCKG
jgi:pimeloyl-ACP methyl ester carboxylesterase